MELKEIIKFEHSRKEEDANTIYLYKSNDDWWKAYEFSAYLCVYFPNGLSEDKQLKVTKKHYYFYLQIKLEKSVKINIKKIKLKIKNYKISKKVQKFICC